MTSISNAQGCGDNSNEKYTDSIHVEWSDQREANLGPEKKKDMTPLDVTGPGDNLLDSGLELAYDEFWNPGEVAEAVAGGGEVLTDALTAGLSTIPNTLAEASVVLGSGSIGDTLVDMAANALANGLDSLGESLEEAVEEASDGEWEVEAGIAWVTKGLLTVRTGIRYNLFLCSTPIDGTPLSLRLAGDIYTKAHYQTGDWSLDAGGRARAELFHEDSGLGVGVHAEQSVTGETTVSLGFSVEVNL